MADQVRFNRDAVGVVSSSNWTDSEMLNNIARGYNDPIYTIPSVLPPLPNGSKNSVSRLNSLLLKYLNLAQTCTHELSDAAAVLGSGAETSIANFDEAETVSADQYRRLRDIMGQKKMGDD